MLNLRASELFYLAEVRRELKIFAKNDDKPLASCHFCKAEDQIQSPILNAIPAGEKEKRKQTQKLAWRHAKHSASLSDSIRVSSEEMDMFSGSFRVTNNLRD